MAKATVPYAAVGVFEAARNIICGLIGAKPSGSDIGRQFPGGESVETGRKERNELEMESGFNQDLLPSQLYRLVQSNIKSKVARTSMAEIMTQMWISFKYLNDLTG
jgi:hypothetical protein